MSQDRQCATTRAVRFAPVAFEPWVADFVRDSNEVAGIERSPTTAEVAAHRGLLALQRLRAENLERFVHHLDPAARMQTPTAQLQELLDAAHEGRIGAEAVRDAFLTLSPFTGENCRVGRALELWYAVKLSEAASVH